MCKITAKEHITFLPGYSSDQVVRTSDPVVYGISVKLPGSAGSLLLTCFIGRTEPIVFHPLNAVQFGISLGTRRICLPKKLEPS